MMSDEKGMGRNKVLRKCLNEKDGIGGPGVRGRKWGRGKEVSLSIRLGCVEICLRRGLIIIPVLEPLAGTTGVSYNEMLGKGIIGYPSRDRTSPTNPFQHFSFVLNPLMP